MRVPNWMRLSRRPDEVIGAHEMLRWWLLPQNRLFNVYLHRHTGVDPRYLHDHPCDNLSIRLAGELIEFTPMGFGGMSTSYPVPFVRGPEGRVCYFDGDEPKVVRAVLGRIRWRRAEDAHRLEIGSSGVAWTLWVRFPNRRRWGYYEPRGWRPAVTFRQPGAK